MRSTFRQCSIRIRTLLRSHSTSHIQEFSNTLSSRQTRSFKIPIHHFHHINSTTDDHKLTDPQNPSPDSSTDHEAIKIQTLLKIHSHNTPQEIEPRLDECGLVLSEDLIINVLKRHRFDWKLAYAFFRWVSRGNVSTGFSPSISVYNEMIDILGRMKQFDQVRKVFDEMSKRSVAINEQTYRIVVSRLAAGQKVDEAIEFFNKIQDLGLKRDLNAFQILLMWLCRHKHVETAEVLFRNHKHEFEDDIKTWNIILNGWCVLGSLPDAKRFWKDIVTSECKPDKFTYGIFINALSKSGKISTAMKLLKSMWRKGGRADVAICNTVIDGLCFKKRIPEALEIFAEMNEGSCLPNVATYNSLIKHLCKIQRMEKVRELVDEMEERGESCSPNVLTYTYLLRAAKKAEEVDGILEKMEKSGCKMEADTYNLILRLFMEWRDEGRVKRIWNEMERNGLGPDRRSYTIVIHGHYDKGMVEDALKYHEEMISKGMVPEPRTKILVDDMRCKLNDL